MHIIKIVGLVVSNAVKSKLIAYKIGLLLLSLVFSKVIKTKFQHDKYGL